MASELVRLACGVRAGLSVGLIPRSAPVCCGCVCWSVGGLQFDSFQLLCCLVTSHRGDVCPTCFCISQGSAFVRAVGTVGCSWMMPLVCVGHWLPAFAAPSDVLVWCSPVLLVTHTLLPRVHVSPCMAYCRTSCRSCMFWSCLLSTCVAFGCIWLQELRGVVWPVSVCCLFGTVLELVGGQQGSRLLYTV